MVRTKDYFASDKFKQDVRNLVGKMGLSNDFSIIPIKGGKNNRIFCVDIQDWGKNLLKAYFQHPKDSRDRLNAEFSFYTFAWENRLRCLPKPYASDSKNQLGLYEFIEGRKINVSEINQEFVNKALDFFIKLNESKNSPKAKGLPNASEACFSINDHLNYINRRLAKLKEIKSNSEIDHKALYFIQNKLSNVWKKAVESCQEDIAKHGLNPNEYLLPEERCISPSDFGYHNALIDNSDKLYFIDFEYSGWDDPAKMVCDYFCQPEVQVPTTFYNFFINKIAVNTPNPKKFKHRVNLLLPIYKIKWCCILLNEFIEVGHQRRNFAYGTTDLNKYKFDQLKKTIKYFERCNL